MLRIKLWQAVVVVLICVAGVLFALPNVFSEKSLQSYPSWLPRSPVNLGLDLQGGSHLVLEVKIEEMIRERMAGVIDEVRAKLRGEKIGYTGLKSVEAEARVQVTSPETLDRATALIREIDKQLDVVGAADGTITVKFSDSARKEMATSAVNQSIEIVRRRIDESGTKEPTIQRQGSDRVLLQLPGIDNPEQVKALLVQTAKLTFHLLDPTISPAEARRSGVPPSDMLLPSDEQTENGKPIEYVVRKRAILSGDMLVNAQPTFQDNQPVVSFKFDSVGSRRFGEITTQNVGKPFAIVLDRKVISAPVIRQPIVGGSGIISGHFTTESAAQLSLLLRAGALPASLTVIEERTVGPDLGADSIRAGALASIVALAGVVVFMFVSYGFFGMVANVAVVLNLILILAIMSMFHATLTLPGIAGIVLTLGVAVDANVLIYERIREEVRNGKSTFAAMEAGFRRAYATILDSNLTHLISAVVLYAVGTGPIRGFAVAAGIGVATTLFTQVLVSRYMLVWWLRTRRPKTLPI